MDPAFLKLLNSADRHYGFVMAIILTEGEFFIDNLPGQIHMIIEMISADWPCAMTSFVNGNVFHLE